MKFRCECGATVHDALAGNKARYIRDLDWDGLLEALDAAIETSGPTPAEKEAACQRVRTRLTSLARSLWQCPACQRLHLDDQGHALHSFRPSDEQACGGLFAAGP